MCSKHSPLVNQRVSVLRNAPFLLLNALITCSLILTAGCENRPAQVLLSFPFYGEENVSVNPTFLFWEPACRATGYILNLTSDSTMGVYTSIHTTEPQARLEGLSYSTTYYWRVMATNEYGNSGWSNVGRFTTRGTYPWVSKNPMPTARHSLAAAVADNKIYALGGVYFRLSPKTSNVLNTVEEYDPAKNTWTKRAGMRIKRRDLAAAVVNNRIYAIGGYTGTDALNTVEEYNPAKNSWASKAPMPTPRYLLAAAVVNNKIYAIGGCKELGAELEEFPIVEEYDPATDRWTPKRAMSILKGSVLAAVVNNRIYAIDEVMTGEYYSLVVEEYDPATDQWSKKLEMPSCGDINFYAALVVNNKIYVFGESGQGIIYYPVENTWKHKEGSVLCPPFHYVTAVVYNKIYFLGGFSNWGYQSVNWVLEYDPALDH